MLTKSAPRIILYGRHSTSLQTATSSEDQTASCMKLVDYLKGTVVATFHDPAESGYKRNRPGLKQLLRMIEDGSADMIVCETLDRIARDGEDIAWLGKNSAITVSVSIRSPKAMWIRSSSAWQLCWGPFSSRT